MRVPLPEASRSRIERTACSRSVAGWYQYELAVMGLLGKVFGLEKKGKIGLSVNKPSYIAGELVVGRIFISVFEPIQCDAVVLKATGKEKLKWTEVRTETTGDGQSETKREDHDREKEFFKQKITISSIAQTYAPGNYVYPFEYQLPADLPGVFSMEQYSEGNVEALSGKISYKLKATLDVGGYLAKDLKATCQLAVHERLTQGIAPSHDSTKQDVRLLCCINRGTCSLEVAMDKNVYLPGETAQVACKIANASQVDIHTMSCKLLQDIKLSIPGHSFHFTRKLCEQSFPGVPAGASLEQPQPLPLVPNTGRESHINLSTSGHLISCSYRVDIACDIPWCPDVHLRMPVTIIAPMIPNVCWVPADAASFVAPH